LQLGYASKRFGFDGRKVQGDSRASGGYVSANTSRGKCCTFGEKKLVSSVHKFSEQLKLKLIFAIAI
jgi:hypothetical protein